MLLSLYSAQVPLTSCCISLKCVNKIFCDESGLVHSSSLADHHNTYEAAEEIKFTETGRMQCEKFFDPGG